MGYYSSLIILIPAVILTFYAQIRVKSAYGKYRDVPNASGVTGLEAAETILINNRVEGISIDCIQGNLTDNYNPVNKCLSLSYDVYHNASVAAVGIAAHECGHALQDHRSYALLKFRNNMVPTVNLCSNLAWPVIVFGMLFGAARLQTFGTILFAAVVLFHLVTLPVELDASRQGIKMLTEYGILISDEDKAGAKAVLNAAALTYVASLAAAIANLVRILTLTRNSRR